MTNEEWLAVESPELLLESLRATAGARELRLCAVALCRRVEQHLTPECRVALEVAEDYAHANVDEGRRRAVYKSVEASCIYVDGDSPAPERFSGFAAEAVLCTLFGADDAPSIPNYAATCAIAASRAVVEVLVAAAELQGRSEEELDCIVEDESRAHCQVIRSMLSRPEPHSR